MRIDLVRTLLVVAACLTQITAQAAQLYQWTDENGKTHFSDKPPAGGQKIDVQEKEVSIHNIDQSSQAVKEANEIHDAKNSYREAKRNESKSEEPETNPAACREALKRLRIISGRVEYVDDEGRPVKVLERDRVKDEANLRAWIRKNC